MNEYHPISFGNFYHKKASGGQLKLSNRDVLYQVATIGLFQVEAIQAGFHPSEVEEHLTIPKYDLVPVEINADILKGLGFGMLNKDEFILRLPERVMGSTYMLVAFDNDRIWLSYTSNPSKGHGECLREVEYIHQIQNAWIGITDRYLYLSEEYIRENYPIQSLRRKITSKQ